MAHQTPQQHAPSQPPSLCACAIPQVKFVLKHNSRLGEVWKLSGSASELGNWIPEVSPSLSWREGGVWSAEVALPPGHYSFKCMLRTADGNYVWEGGENRTITVSDGSGSCGAAVALGLAIAGAQQRCCARHRCSCPSTSREPASVHLSH